VAVALLDKKAANSKVAGTAGTPEWTTCATAGFIALIEAASYTLPNRLFTRTRFERLDESVPSLNSFPHFNLLQLV